jgi:membrane fusion protein (multidrug efflux system)
VAGLAAACGKQSQTAANPPAEEPAGGTPVHVASVASTTLYEIVSAPGHTSALAGQKVRAPFSGILMDLLVADGDAVSRGQVLATIVSRDSEAALSGAREMAREARSAREKEDAERAITLAQKDLVRAALRASASGMVGSHAANRGDRVAEGDEILTISAPDSIVFLADVTQSDIPRIRTGQRGEVELGGRPQPIAGVVYAVLPAANAADFTVPVRIDLRGVSERFPAGLFGAARITIGQRSGVLALPEAAILRDDVTGVSRVAIVDQGRVHWIVVTTGVRGKGNTEVTSGNLTEAQKVIVSGQVGLPEGSPVVIEP